MRNMLALFALVLLTSASPAQGQDWLKKAFLANGGSDRNDFGNQPRGTQLYHRFPMTNIWAVPLEILPDKAGLRTSCGCVTVTPTKYTLQPREQGYLEVIMDTRKFIGPKTVTIFVTVGPEFTSTATIQVSANSRTDVVFNPGQVEFGVVPAGQSPTQTIEVEYAGVLDWRVNDVMKNGAPLDATLEEMYRRQGQVGYRVRVALKNDVLPGSQKWEMHLKTNDPASPLVPILVTATVQASLTVAPNPVNLRSVKLGDTVSQRVVVRGTKPFRIVAVEGVGDGILADFPSVAAPVQIVTLKCQPTATGDLRRQLVIKTDLSTEAPVTFTVEGNVTP